ncbi:MAG TPA: XdhC/CoxI family protein [Tepidisphaeraceae bacterium]|nr:XdhC/CoxI family protein [Tepidisphaeraceae bacterium]
MQNPWDEIAGSLRARRPVVVATIVRDSGSVPRRSGAKMLIYPDRRTVGSIGGGLFELIIIRDALAVLNSATSVTRSYSFNPKFTSDDAFGAVCGGRAEVFLEVVMPPDRLLIVGGGHCGRAVARAASLLDFSIVVADDREEYAQVEDFQFPGVEAVMHLPPDFAGLPVPDERTYVVLVSKGYTTDGAALRRVIDTPAAYIGMIGSQKKRQTVYDELRSEGMTEQQIGRVHGPIGLDIGAETPEEIAISILAQVIQARAQRRDAAMTVDEASKAPEHVGVSESRSPAPA